MKSAALSVTVGKSGTGGSETTCGVFFVGTSGFVGPFADRLLGSPAIYGHEEREVEQSVNYVTCHDGFTLNDLVSYSRKHNEANGRRQP